MNKITTQILKIKSLKMPPSADFIENEIKKAGINPIRWAIIEVEKDIENDTDSIKNNIKNVKKTSKIKSTDETETILTISVAGEKI